MEQSLECFVEQLQRWPKVLQHYFAISKHWKQSLGLKGISILGKQLLVKAP